MEKDKLYSLCRIIPEKYGVEPSVAYGIIMTESGGEEWASRYEPTNRWKFFPQRYHRRLNITLETEKVLQDTSYGLFQVMGSTARSMGFKEMLGKLYQVDLNFHYGLTHLKSHLAKYAGDVQDAVAAYNAGSARKVLKPDGTREYVNQVHINRFLRFHNEFE